MSWSKKFEEIDVRSFSYSGGESETWWPQKHEVAWLLKLAFYKRSLFNISAWIMLKKFPDDSGKNCYHLTFTVPWYLRHFYYLKMLLQIYTLWTKINILAWKYFRPIQYCIGTFLTCWWMSDSWFVLKSCLKAKKAKS